MQTTKTTPVRLATSDHELLKQAAKMEQETIQNYIINLISKDLKAKGLMN